MDMLGPMGSALCLALLAILIAPMVAHQYRGTSYSDSEYNEFIHTVLVNDKIYGMTGIVTISLILNLLQVE